MGKKMLCLYPLSYPETESARKTLGVERTVKAPAYVGTDLRIPSNIPTINGRLESAREWIDSVGRKGDYLFIRGEDPGACWLMVRYAFERELVPVYSVAEAQTVSQRRPDGSTAKVRTQAHRRFREFENPS